MPRRRGRRGNIPANRERAWKALRKKMPERIAAAIAVKGRTRQGRKEMARKAARTRKARGGFAKSRRKRR
jgi:hypothetical protein